MPHRPPRKWKELPAHCTEAHRRFVWALRAVRECSEETQEMIARRANQSYSTLSNHLNGGRVPEIQLLTSFYKVVREDALASGHAVPHTLDALLEMRLHALEKHCACCTVGFPSDVPAVTPVAPPQPPSEPASRRVPRVPRKPRTVRYASGRSFSTLAARTRVPVPHPEGDRHPETQLEEQWAELGTLRRYLSEGRDRDAFMMLWSAATTLPSTDVPIVVSACRSAGLNEEANTVLTSAGKRDAQAVINIASAFHDRQLYADAGLILTTATEAQQEEN